MSVWSDLRAAIRQVMLMQERAERLTADVEKLADRLLEHDRRITRIETLIAVAQRKSLT
jgi:hypothetical protein